MTTPEIIEKIRKLLRMKRGGTPEEIATALRLAQELAAKHGVDLDGVNPDDEGPKPIGHQDVVDGLSRIQFEAKYAALVCDRYFNVKAFFRQVGWRKYSMTFVGTAVDREIAGYVFAFLLGCFRREWRANSKRLRNRQAFLWGMYCGICHRLWERQPVTDGDGPAGLVVAAGKLARSNYVAAHFGELQSDKVEPDGNAQSAKTAGIMAGLATEIRPGVQGGTARAALGTGRFQLEMPQA